MHADLRIRGIDVHTKNLSRNFRTSLYYNLNGHPPRRRLKRGRPHDLRLRRSHNTCICILSDVKLENIIVVTYHVYSIIFTTIIITHITISKRRNQHKCILLP